VRSRTDASDQGLINLRGVRFILGRTNYVVALKCASKLTVRSLSCVAGSAAILFGASTLIATKRPVPSIPTAGTTELEMQVLLDRADFSPGEIDGTVGKNSSKALAAFQAARGLAPGTRNRKALLAALGAGEGVEPIISYTITAEDAAGPFSAKIPEDMLAKSRLPGLYYTSVLQELSEKFHSSPALLKRLNPGVQFTSGEQIRVPNVARTEREALNAERLRSSVLKVVVSKKAAVLKVYDGKGQIIFFAPVTSGSVHAPLPFGNWKVTEVRRNPTYDYNPNLFWDPKPTSAKETIAAGPNNPVGVVWIGISDPHYGIHGTPDPGEIGYSQSDGCVRLTNWDASRLASMVTKGTRVVFEE
jgi:lipoprotein-anchoring transpeptidase ErfK/SrfK